MAINAVNPFGGGMSMVSSLYGSMYQSNMSLYSYKLNNSRYPVNKAKAEPTLSAGSVQYVKNIKQGATKLASSLKTLSGGAAFDKETGIDRAKSAVNDLVMSYNDIYIEAAKNSSDPKAESLASRLLSVSKTYSGSLSEIGVGFDKDGKMTIDAKKLDKAAESGALEKFFKENSGKNYGFTYQLGKLAGNISSNTSDFVTKSGFGSSLTQNFSYSGIGSLQSYKYSSTGWLIDYLR